MQTTLNPEISEWGNPAQFTELPLVEHIDQMEGTGGTETSKYPEEKKSNEIPGVAVSEMGRA